MVVVFRIAGDLWVDVGAIAGGHVRTCVAVRRVVDIVLDYGFV